MSLSNNYPTIQPTLNLSFALTKQLDPRITFTRTSTATYYDGVTTAMAEQNLLTWSQDFDNAVWSKTNITVTANSIAAPDGNTTADTITATASASSSKSTAWTSGTTVTTSYASSVYIKAGTLTKVGIREAATVGNWATFDVSGGTVIANAAGVTASITNVGNGWYRCQMINPTTGTVNLQIILLDSAYTNTNPFSYAWTSAGTETLYLWGAQLENRSSVTAYTATTTQPITNYIPVLLTAASGIPRFNHNPTTGESLGLLIEESRTNLLTYSADWSNAAWTKGGATISADSNVAPDGTLTADRLVEDTSTGDHRAFQLTAFTSGTAYTFTVYAKASGRNLLMLANTMAGGFTSVFDLNAGTITSTTLGTAAITNVGNGWYRCSVSNTSGFTGNSNNQIRLVDTGTNTSYTGNGFSGAFLWGSQLEAGSFATSYIKTEAATVTRSADAASMTGTNFSSWYRPDEGTLFESSIFNGTSSGYGYYNIISDGNSVNNEIALTSDSGLSSFRVRANAVDQFVVSSGTLVGNVAKILAYKVNDFAGCTNAGAVQTDNSGTLPVVDRLSVSAQLVSRNIRKIAFYPARLTNAQLQALTTV